MGMLSERLSIGFAAEPHMQLHMWPFGGVFLHAVIWKVTRSSHALSLVTGASELLEPNTYATVVANTMQALVHITGLSSERVPDFLSKKTKVFSQLQVSYCYVIHSHVRLQHRHCLLGLLSQQHPIGQCYL